jgi:hypothetical protein
MRPGTARPDFRKRREADFWNAVNKLIFVLCAAGGLVLIGLLAYPELRRIDEMEKNVIDLEAERDAESLLLQKQRREERWLKEDPAYVELLAREKFGMMKDGETVFRLDEEVPPAFVPGDAAPTAPAPSQ